MNSLKSGFKRLPRPVRWVIIGAIAVPTVGLVAAQFDFFWEDSPRDHLAEFLIGLLFLGAVAGLFEWWFYVGFKRATGLEPVWIPRPIREASARRRERRRQRHRRGPTTAELLGGPHPRAAGTSEAAPGRRSPVYLPGQWEIGEPVSDDGRLLTIEDEESPDPPPRIWTPPR